MGNPGAPLKSPCAKRWGGGGGEGGDTRNPIVDLSQRPVKQFLTSPGAQTSPLWDSQEIHEESDRPTDKGVRAYTPFSRQARNRLGTPPVACSDTPGAPLMILLQWGKHSWLSLPLECALWQAVHQLPCEIPSKGVRVFPGNH